MGHEVSDLVAAEDGHRRSQAKPAPSWYRPEVAKYCFNKAILVSLGHHNPGLQTEHRMAGWAERYASES